MNAHDYFVAQLRCPCCGDRSAEDRSTNICTRLATDPRDADRGVGAEVRFDLARVPKRGYCAIRPPRPGEGLRLLEAWSCPACGSGASWAEVHIMGGVIIAIEVAPLEVRALEHAHFLSEAAIRVVERARGPALDALPSTELVCRLREVLA